MCGCEYVNVYEHMSMSFHMYSYISIHMCICAYLSQIRGLDPWRQGSLWDGVCEYKSELSCMHVMQMNLCLYKWSACGWLCVSVREWKCYGVLVVVVASARRLLILLDGHCLITGKTFD